MKCIRAMALATAIVFITAFSGTAFAGVWDDIKKNAKETGQDIKKDAQEIKKDVKDTGKAVKEGGKKNYKDTKGAAQKKAENRDD